MSNRKAPESKKQPRKLQPGVKLRSAEKVRQIPTRNLETETSLRKPDWIRIRLPAGNEVGEVQKIKKLLREHKLSTVCEEAS